MTEKNINNANKMLFYRTILCFDVDTSEKVTVTGIAKKLNVEKYQISRIISTLETQGIVEKDEKGVPSLTDEGESYLKEYHDRVDLLVSYLLRAGLNPQYARDIAMHIAGNANDTIMQVIREKEIRMQTKEALETSAKFSGSQFSKKMQSGSYSLPFLIVNYKNGVLPGFLQQSSSNAAILNIVNKKGTIQLHLGNDKVKELHYYLNGEYIQAEKVGDIFFMPADVLTFMQIAKASQEGVSFCGMENIKLYIAENTGTAVYEGIFEILF